MNPSIKVTFSNSSIRSLIIVEQSTGNLPNLITSVGNVQLQVNAFLSKLVCEENTSGQNHMLDDEVDDDGEDEPPDSNDEKKRKALQYKKDKRMKQ